MINIRLELFVLLVVHMNSVAVRSLVEDLRWGRERETESCLVCVQVLGALVFRIVPLGTPLRHFCHPPRMYTYH